MGRRTRDIGRNREVGKEEGKRPSDRAAGIVLGGLIGGKKMAEPKVPLKVRQALEVLRRGLVKVYGPRLVQVYLYGSYARGEACEDSSDVDLLVVLKGDVQPAEELERIGRFVSDIALEYDLLLSVYPVSAKWFARRQSPFFIQVRQEAIPV